ncbi:fatty acid--CoA ligase family protein [Microbacterium sp. MM2322]|uniref:ANL family adenylate-forming protein n=1 Tax=Microbacterium sp. MM2322 TaxID=3157631 RepID=UPI0032D58D05
MITPIRADSPKILEQLRAVRAAGQVPLVTDPRWDWLPDGVAGDAFLSSELPADVAWATTTSGSSGNPRVVIRTASSWADSFAAVSEMLKAGHDDHILLPGPPSSSLTLFSLAHALEDGPRPLLGLAAIGSPMAERATCMHGTPHALRAVLDAGLPANLRVALIGGSSLDFALRSRAEAAGVRVIEYYGAAELSFVATDEGSGLHAFPEVRLDVRDEELWVSSPYIAIGYLGEPGPLRLRDDWATVGDRARISDGTLQIRGRRDGAILTASATVIPEDVETTLRAAPGVRDAFVCGIPHPSLGALLSAYVELAGPDRPDLHDLTRHLAPSHRPRRWFAGPLPRTASGKIARAEAERRMLAGEVPRFDPNRP